MRSNWLTSIRYSHHLSLWLWRCNTPALLTICLLIYLIWKFLQHTIAMLWKPKRSQINPLKSINLILTLPDKWNVKKSEFLRQYRNIVMMRDWWWRLDLQFKWLGTIELVNNHIAQNTHIAWWRVAYSGTIYCFFAIRFVQARESQQDYQAGVK